VDRGWLGSQAFAYASAFNADIGAWNTAAVTSLNQVCAAISGPGVKRDALGGASMRRGPLWAAATADARSCADVSARACAGVHVRRYSCA
jgi:hypothetical protein